MVEMFLFKTTVALVFYHNKLDARNSFRVHMKDNSNICLNRRVQQTLSIGMALLLVYGFFVGPAFSEAPANKEAGSIQIDFESGSVSAKILKAPLLRVLAAVEEKTGVQVTDAGGLDEIVSLSVSKIPLEEFLALLFENRALVYERIPETDTFRVIGLGAYNSQKEEPNPLRVAEKTGDKLAHHGSRRLEADEKKFGTRTQPLTSKETDSQGRPLYKAGEILVRFKSDAPPGDIAALHRRLGSRMLARLNSRRLEKIAVAEGMNEAEAVARYMTSNLVENTERHALRYPLEIPSDPLFDQQWGLERISAPAGWKFTTGDGEVIVAVVDSGVDYSHPDLSQNIWINTAEFGKTAGVDDDGNGYIDDIFGWDFAGTTFPSSGDPDPADSAVSGHGTHVAGIVAARGDNNEGVSGTAWQLKIMALKVKPDDSEFFELFSVIEALDYARQKGAKVVNCSFGGETNSDEERNAFQDLEAAGILAVCAAGNGGEDLDAAGNDLYPAEYDFSNILTVTAATQSDSLAYFSNYGLTAVDVAAPGVSIKSTVPTEAVTEASVAAGGSSYAANGMLYAGTTGEGGVTGVLLDCGGGYEDEFPEEFSTGDIALIERGNRDGVDFYFSEKVANAQTKGAAAVIIYNNTVDSLDQNGGTLGSPDSWIPAVSVTRADGLALKSFLDQPATVINQVPETAYAYNQGTSMAAPFVSGLAGLLWSKEATLSPDQVKTAIMETVDKIPALSGKIASGGRINAQGALCSINPLKGDLNCDGQVGLDDAVYGAQIITGKSSYVCRCCLSTGTDPVADDTVTLLDVLYLLQDLAGLR